MTTPPSAQHRVARRDVTSGAAQALPSQDVRPFELRSRRRMDSKVFSILVILHYLLKNNSWDLYPNCATKITGGALSSVLTGSCECPSN